MTTRRRLTDAELIEHLVEVPCDSDLRRIARKRGITRMRTGPGVVVIRRRRSHGRA